MKISKELADSNHCVLCRRAWEEVHGSDWKNCGVLNLIYTSRNLAICWRCNEVGDDLVMNGCDGTISFYDNLPLYITESCRFCGTLNSRETPIYQPSVLILFDDRFSDLFLDYFELSEAMRWARLKTIKGDLGVCRICVIEIMKLMYTNWLESRYEPEREYARKQLAKFSSWRSSNTQQSNDHHGDVVNRETTGQAVTHTPGGAGLYVVGGTNLDRQNDATDYRCQTEPEQPEPKHISSRAVVIGYETQTNNSVEIGDIERRSGLYILGKPRMGKSTLLVNIAMQDMLKGYNCFFLDPHGQAIKDLIEHSPAVGLAVKRSLEAGRTSDIGGVYLLNPTDDDYSFGINPLYCKNVASRSERNEAFNKTYSIFKRIWERDNQWGVWLDLVLRNALPVLIETQQTLAEMPLFLNNQNFRNFLLRRLRHNTGTLDFWNYEFKQEQAQPAIVRVRALLGDDDYVRDIIGQQKTTIDFSALTTNVAQFLLYRLPPNLNEESGRFIGTILTTELLHAIRSRTQEHAKHNYCLFIDEFQHFTRCRPGCGWN